MESSGIMLTNMDKIMKGTWHLANSGITTEKIDFSHEQRLFLQSMAARIQSEAVMRSLELHAACQKSHIIDGCRYWCFRKKGEIVGVTGIHYRMWDHSSVVWTSPCITSSGLNEQTRLAMLCNNLYYCIVRTQFREIYFELTDDDAFSENDYILTELFPEKVAVLPLFSAGKRICKS
ncbi:hypothetical protein ABN097_23885 [Enterobacter cloacae]|uniref:hypothetical protein n=1 Tax=Enterobacter cloacae TaxID=550 RepID=UPI00325B5049